MNKSIAKRREKILEYLGQNDTRDLIFSVNGDGEANINIDPNWDLKTLVLKVLHLTYNHHSVLRDDYGILTSDTRPDKRRSSLDIWRHVKYFRPDVDIFSVMEALYLIAIHCSDIHTNYCYQVKRTVFSFSYDEPRVIWRSILNDFLDHLRIGYELHWGVKEIICNEYRIKFSTWKCLH